jgi:hypothetical protein
MLKEFINCPDLFISNGFTHQNNRDTFFCICPFDESQQERWPVHPYLQKLETMVRFEFSRAGSK